MYERQLAPSFEPFKIKYFSLNSCLKQQACYILPCEQKKKSKGPGLELLICLPLCLPPCSLVAVPLLDLLACVWNKNVWGLLSCWFQVTALPSHRRIGAWREQVFILSGGQTHGCLKRRRRRRQVETPSPRPGHPTGVYLTFLNRIKFEILW